MQDPLERTRTELEQTVIHFLSVVDTLEASKNAAIGMQLRSIKQAIESFSFEASRVSKTIEYKQELLQ